MGLLHLQGCVMAPVKPSRYEFSPNSIVEIRQGESVNRTFGEPHTQLLRPGLARICSIGSMPDCSRVQAGSRRSPAFIPGTATEGTEGTEGYIDVGGDSRGVDAYTRAISSFPYILQNLQFIQ